MRKPVRVAAAFALGAILLELAGMARELLQQTYSLSSGCNPAELNMLP